LIKFCPTLSAEMAAEMAEMSANSTASLVELLNALPPPGGLILSSAAPRQIMEANLVGDSDLQKINTTSAWRWVDVLRMGRTSASCSRMAAQVEKSWASRERASSTPTGAPL
jgi:hypothetical protein